MQVKFFWMNNPHTIGHKSSAEGQYARELENQINAWLGENPRIKIFDIKQSSSGDLVPLWFLSIWYEEENPRPKTPA